ncbi:hypothetical protein [Winogradskyella sp.]|jgi:hypothetical protein|uniref:hypothetical protein n=1 Tax=Winogradskyella sp. TaxID=1883156 RepID=UPI0025EAFC76|nr:hypothetical protein [Winogradskyella sp.]MCT4629167.1 hypothetical protein [Winogradskyella sp.]
MDRLQQKLEKIESKNLRTDKKRYNRKVINGSLIATIVAATPFLFYLYEYVPEAKVWETFLFTYESNHFEDASTGIWVLMMKVVPLLLTIVWFFTCKHWWYHALIVPIAMFTFQVVSALSQELYMDVLHIIYLLPIMAIIFPSIYLIRAKMFYRINDHDKTMEELEEEFMMKPKTIWGKVKQYF